MRETHHSQIAKAPNELVVRGDYLAIQIGRIVLHSTLRPSRYSDDLQQVTLIETTYSNLWGHRIPTDCNRPLLIDSDGFQHSGYSTDEDACVIESTHLPEGTRVPGVAAVIEGQARSRGWIAFPELPDPVVPHRLIFRTYIYAPGATSGTVKHSETLELVFDLSVFKRILNDAPNA